MRQIPLSSLAKQIRGVSYRPSDLHDKLDSESVVLLRANNICDGLLNLDDVVYVDRRKVSPEQYLRKGDILICASSGSRNLVGKAAQVQFDGKFTFGAFCKVVRPLKINPSYIGMYFQSPIYRHEIARLAQGININNIKNEHVDTLMINVYDESEQRTIIHTLHAVTSVIHKRQEELYQLDMLIKAQFMEMFGDPDENPHSWDKAPLQKVIINANNGMARRGNDVNGNIVMRLVELQDGHIDYSNPNRIILKENEKKKYLLKDKDFLFARVNGNPDNVGRCAVFHEIGEEVYHNDHIIRVHFDEEMLNGTFASVLLNSDYGKRQLRSQIKTSAGQYTVSQDGIGAIITILPPMELQGQFATFVAQVDKSKLAVTKCLKKAEYLKSALMQKYFG